jgi:hypothetical protein
MRRLTWVLLLLVLGACLSPRQRQHQEQMTKLVEQADSVLLVSHEPTDGYYFMDEKTGLATLPPEPILIENRLNRKIVKELVVVRGAKLTQLSALLTRPLVKQNTDVALCFIPHHSILLFKNGQASYINICFICQRVAASPDIPFTDEDMDRRKWRELKAFIQAYGIKYELDKVTIDR